jgi:translation initiation factor 2 beta subunit (eIF-2beta)/eIF-5
MLLIPLLHSQAFQPLFFFCFLCRSFDKRIGKSLEFFFFKCKLFGKARQILGITKLKKKKEKKS